MEFCLDFPTMAGEPKCPLAKGSSLQPPLRMSGMRCRRRSGLGDNPIDGLHTSREGEPSCRNSWTGSVEKSAFRFSGFFKNLVCRCMSLRLQIKGSWHVKSLTKHQTQNLLTERKISSYAKSQNDRDPDTVEPGHAWRRPPTRPRPGPTRSRHGPVSCDQRLRPRRATVGSPERGCGTYNTCKTSGI